MAKLTDVVVCLWLLVVTYVVIACKLLVGISAHLLRQALGRR